MVDIVLKMYTILSSMAHLKRTSVEEIYSRLKRDIISHSLKPGQNLIEEQIAARFGVSRTPVRQVFALLASGGFVEYRRHKGVVVNSIHLRDIQEIYELRAILESSVAEAAAHNATPQDIKRLRKLARAGYRFRDRASYDKFIRNNLEFHVGIARLTGNARLVQMLEAVLDQMHRVFWASLDLQDFNREATREHLELLDAIAAHDPTRARRLVQEQMRSSQKRAFWALQQSGDVSISG